MGTVLAVGIWGMSLPMTMLVFGVPAIAIRLWQIRGQGADEAAKTQISKKE
jgi:hypothetical protein